jgi:hypothetical protein
MNTRVPKRKFERVLVDGDPTSSFRPHHETVKPDSRLLAERACDVVNITKDEGNVEIRRQLGLGVEKSLTDRPTQS